MTKSPPLRRYLVNVDSASTPTVSTDCAVIGAGIAGLRAAIEAAEHCNVIVLCKGSFEESNTWNAQGGIASVLDETDTFESHIADTLKAGCGICDEAVVEMVVRQGPQLVRQLLEWGTRFDTDNGRIATTLEGGHSHARVAHAHGDETGKIIAQTLIDKVTQNPRVQVIEHFFVIDLLSGRNNECIGLIGRDSSGNLRIIRSTSTILATGGAGQLYRETTNPQVATADGIAAAYRAGAVLADLEMMQFHPTTLYIAGASRALVTEALRGEGAVLVDKNGRAFMKQYHPDAELAPRDIVSRAILSHMLKTNSTHVYLDARRFDKRHFEKRFPHIFELCESFDIDVARDLIPVRPSAHYMIGGVKVDRSAATSVRNLYACGEVACTGLHGANRLGSNSLLEGLVFGRIAGRSAAGNLKTAARPAEEAIEYRVPDSGRSRLDTADVRNSLRALMWRNVGITRTHRALAEAREIIEFWQRYVMDKVFGSPQGWECQNMLTVALLMAQAAQMRRESRGVHYRSDFPQTYDEQFKKHIEISRPPDILG